MPLPEPIRVVLLHHRSDTPYLLTLVTHLGSLHATRTIDLWHPGELEAGMHITNEMTRRIGNAHILVPLLSADFLTFWANSLSKAFRPSTDVVQRFVPIYVRPCHISDPFFSELQGLPRDKRPLAGRDGSFDEAAVASVAEELLRLVGQFRGGGQRPTVKREDVTKTLSEVEVELYDLKREAKALVKKLDSAIAENSHLKAALQRRDRDEEGAIGAELVVLRDTLSKVLGENVAETAPGELVAMAVLLLERNHLHNTSMLVSEPCS